MTALTMTVREKIGQLILTGFSAPEITADLHRLVAEYKIGNIILFSHNVGGVDQLSRLCGELQAMIVKETGRPALISIDQEGGRVTRLPNEATNVPGAMAIAAGGRPEQAYAAGRITARELRALGINFNLAPVLDINNNPHNPVINVRSYGDTAETVTEYGLQMLRGLQDGGVLAAVKHFPGHGDTAVDSHLGLPVIGKTLAELEALELAPFRRAIEAGAESVMTAHILFPALEAERVPATMSRTIVTGLLKNELKFDGLIVSDCLEMDAIKKFYGTARGALGALKAGVHMVFVSHTPALVIETVELLERAVQSGELPMEVLDEAVAKVLYYKRKYAAVERTVRDLSIVGCAAHRRSAEQMSLESICRVRGELRRVEPGDPSTIFLGSYPYRSDLASSSVDAAFSFPETLGRIYSTAHQVIGIDPEPDEIERIAADVRSYPDVVIGLYNARENEGQLKLVRRLRELGHQVTAVALGRPYDLELLPDDVCGLAAFEYTPLSVMSVARVLDGSAEPSGRLSIALR